MACCKKIGNQVNCIKMGRECSIHGEEEECIEGIGGEARRKQTTGKT
jgi:hypothetical protein